MESGGALTGGSANRVLYTGPGPVLTDSPNLTFDGTTLEVALLRKQPASGLTATGTTQSDAYAMTAAINEFTTVASGTGAILYSGSAGDSQFVYNGGANTLNVYPPVGSSINNLATNTPATVLANTSCEFFCTSTTQWTTPDVIGSLGVSSGGTGISSYTIGDMIYASGTTTLSKLADVATGNAIISGGIGVAPSYGKIGLTTHVTGQLPLSNGGTNASLTASNGGIFYSTGTAGAILSGTATAGQVLRSGASAAPSWSTATYPNTATATGTVLRADGTNWTATTATYPNTVTASQLLWATGTNVVGQDSGLTYNATGAILTCGAINVSGSTPPTIGWYALGGGIVASAGGSYIGGDTLIVAWDGTNDMFRAIGNAATAGVLLEAIDSGATQNTPLEIRGSTITMKYGATPTTGFTMGNTGNITIAKNLTVTGTFTASTPMTLANITPDILSFAARHG